MRRVLVMIGASAVLALTGNQAVCVVLAHTRIDASAIIPNQGHIHRYDKMGVWTS